ncbi:MAG: hypothetical protein NTW60_00450 [Candidatus Wolfebacteria bacterium]|nr:hypothetical protein [Candidatus Wolfebacteria bacterium]
MKTDNGFRTIIAFAVTAAVALFIYFGAFLPISKSQLYVGAQANLSNVRTIQQFSDVFEKVFFYYSPVGQDEIIQGYLGTLMNIIQQQNPTPGTDAIDYLAKQAEKWGDPIMMRGKAFNYGQIIYSLGAVYKLAAVKLQNFDYYQRSVAAFRDGAKHSPGRAVFLYNLFDLYNMAGDKANARIAGEEIAKNWPNDPQAQQIKEFLDKQ